LTIFFGERLVVDGGQSEFPRERIEHGLQKRFDGRQLDGGQLIDQGVDVLTGVGVHRGSCRVAIYVAISQGLPELRISAMGLLKRVQGCYQCRLVQSAPWVESGAAFKEATTNVPASNSRKG